MNRRNYLQTLSALFAVSAFGGCTSAGKQKDASNSETDIAGPALAGEAFDVPAVSEESKNFYLVSDLGRNGYYEQKTIAELMGNLAEKIDIEFIVAAGDTHHFEGVASVDDPSVRQGLTPQGQAPPSHFPAVLRARSPHPKMPRTFPLPAPLLTLYFHQR